MAFAMALTPRAGSAFQSDWTPHGVGSWSHYNPSPGAVTVGVWLVVAGAIFGCGWFLFARQFSLRSLLVGLILVASFASTPHFMILPKNVQTTIYVRTDRNLTDTQWTVLEQALTRESLCSAVSKSATESLPCPVTDALKQVELEAIREVDADGVRLTIWFSPELDHGQIAGIFGELTEYVRNAVPKEKP